VFFPPEKKVKGRKFKIKPAEPAVKLKLSGLSPNSPTGLIKKMGKPGESP